MPPVFALIGPLLASLGGGSAAAGAATAAGLAGAGVSAAELAKQLTSSGPSPFPSAATVQANKNQLAGVVNQNLPNLQEQGGGGLSPNYDASVIGTTTGTGSQQNLLQDLVNQYLSGNGGSNSPGPPLNTQVSVPSLGTTSLSGEGGLANTSIFT